MKNIVALTGIAFIVYGCAANVDPTKTVSPEKTFDYVTYNSWSELADETYDFRALKWHENEGEMYPNCELNLPSVSFSHHKGCPEKSAGSCYFWDGDNKSIVIVTRYASSCRSQVSRLYHEFSHFLYHCNYGEPDNEMDYFETKEYLKNIETLQEKLCE